MFHACNTLNPKTMAPACPKPQNPEPSNPEPSSPVLRSAVPRVSLPRTASRPSDLLSDPHWQKKKKNTSPEPEAFTVGRAFQHEARRRLSRVYPCADEDGTALWKDPRPLGFLFKTRRLQVQCSET